LNLNVWGKKTIISFTYETISHEIIQELKEDLVRLAADIMSSFIFL